MTDDGTLSRLQEQFHALVDLPVADQVERLRDIERSEPELARELRELLDVDVDAVDADAQILARVFPAGNPGDTEVRQDVISGRRIGSYRLLHEIGSGGMGSVFLAERDDPEFRHQVAIKLVRGFPSAAVLERFRRERELLATLRHPNIARLLDGGTTEDGQPYLVMEYVDGMALDDWCRRERPSLRSRLRLFQLLCDAVQHAHQKLIVHRDLKPANILVRADGAPVLLDFGIGKLLAEADDDVANTTHFRPLTPAYASPEQLRGETVTTLSDVFGLGLVLFELLTGVPYRRRGGDTTRWSASRVAAQTDSWAQADARSLRGDLDNIVGKALQEERERRYVSAAALSADIQAWFEHAPVTAAPDRWSYRLGKFVGRHPIAIGSTLATIVLLVGLSLRLAAESRAARLQAESANQSAAFLVDLLKAAAPESMRGQALTVQGLLQDAREHLEQREFARPEVKARLEAALAEIYHSLGLAEPSLVLQEQAVARLRAHDNAIARPLLAQHLTQLARVYSLVDRVDEAIAAATEALDLARRTGLDRAGEVGRSLIALAHALGQAGRFDEADLHINEAVRLLAAAGDDHRELFADAVHEQGWLAMHGREFEQARTHLHRALELRSELGGDRHPATLATRSLLAETEHALGAFDSSVELFQALLDDEIAVLGSDNQHVANTHNRLGSALHDAGRYTEAGQQYRAALALFEALGEVVGPSYAVPINNYAHLLEVRQDYVEAERMYRRSLALRQELGAQPAAIARAHQNLARVLMLVDRHDEAWAETERAWQVREAFTPTHHPERLVTMVSFIRIALRQGDLETAQAWLQRYEEAGEGGTPSAPAQARERELHAEFAAIRGDLDDEIEQRRAVVTFYGQRLADTQPYLARQRLVLSAALVRRGGAEDLDEARELLRLARDPIGRELDPAAPDRLQLARLEALLSSV